MHAGELLDDLTGIVLAGGSSRRMGRDKALLRLEDRPMIQIVVARMQAVCREVLIVSNETSRYEGFGVSVVTDRFRGVGVLGGLHAGLKAASHELTLAVGCDMPFIKPCVLGAFAGWVVGYDVALLRHDGQVEPLHGAYRRTCLPAIEGAIRSGERRIVSFFPQVRVRTVSPEEVLPIDPRLESFRNVNTPEDWAAVRRTWPDE